MVSLEEFNSIVEAKHLLQHPFYQDWSKGLLTMDDLAFYAEHYYHHVDYFPRYVSATRANCDNLESRQVLLENLIDEEQGDENHPELWLWFAESLGKTKAEIKTSQVASETKNLIDTFYSLARSSYSEGLGALYAYEKQVPKTARSKIDGLKEFYGMTCPKALAFCEVHLGADVWHSQEVADLIEKLPEDQKPKALAATDKVCDALWGFLDGVQEATKH